MAEENRELCPLVNCIKREQPDCKCWFIVDEILLIETKKVGHVGSN